MKRLFDILISVTLTTLLFPILFIFGMLVFFQDFHHPFYFAQRTGKNGNPFTMIKLRSMVVNADRSGVDSTSNTDQRITKIGHIIRKFKLDELTQLVNVLLGDMSLVGPRPNVQRETELYTTQEKKLLTVRPGITDLASIVFSDEGDILEGSEDPDIDYNQLIRPGKGHLGLFYVDNSSLMLDIQIIVLTALAMVNKPLALRGVGSVLTALNAPETILKIASRKEKLEPSPPPGATSIVTNRNSIPT